MDINEARSIALNLISQHGLTGWRFTFDNAQSRLGVCKYATKTISMSIRMVLAAGQDVVEQTMIHEVAHAIVGAGHGHDGVWLAKAQSIGYTGGRTADNPAITEELRRKAKLSGGEFAGDRGHLEAGDRVMLRNGQRGTVTRLGRTRYQVTLTSGRRVASPLSCLIYLPADAAPVASELNDRVLAILDNAATHNTPIPPHPEAAAEAAREAALNALPAIRPFVADTTVLARAGQTVEVLAPAGAKWAGKQYVVAKVNPTRYKVSIGDGRFITIPHELAKPVNVAA